MEFLQWRDAMLQRIRRVISLLGLIEGEDALGPFCRAAQFFIGFELWKLLALANTAPDCFPSDVKLAAVRLIMLIKALPIFIGINDYNCIMIFDEATWESFVNVMASAAGIARLKKIGGLLETLDPVIEGGDANPPTAAREDLSPSKGSERSLPCSDGIESEDSKDENRIVRSLHKLKAYDDEPLAKKGEIMLKVGPMTCRRYDAAMKRLKSRHLVRTASGPRGGAGLTPAGKDLAQSIAH
jgi:hypothetical protein